MKAAKDGQEKRQDPFAEERREGYHYSRKDRMSMATAPRFRNRGGGILRGNRTLLIILLDLVIILVMGLLLARFLYARVNRADVEGYNLVLTGISTGEVAIATLTITNNATMDNSFDQRIIFARFSLRRNPGEEESIYVSEPAPRGRGEERILRAAIPLSASSASSRVVYAEVRIGDSRERLSAGLETRDLR